MRPFLQPHTRISMLYSITRATMNASKRVEVIVASVKSHEIITTGPWRGACFHGQRFLNNFRKSMIEKDQSDSSIS